MNYFTLYDGTDAASANKTSLSFGVGLSGSGVWDAPARKGESISIPGRNGNIWVDDGSWENIFVTYPCWIADGFDQKVDEFRGWLAQHSDKYYRITDTYHPDEYRLGRFAGEFLATPGTRNLTGRFDVVFECDPRRFFVNNVVQDIALSFSSTSPAAVIETFENANNLGVYPKAEIVFPIPGVGETYNVTSTINGKEWLTISNPNSIESGLYTIYANLETGAIYSDEEMITPIYVPGFPYDIPGVVVTPAIIDQGTNEIAASGRLITPSAVSVHVSIRLIINGFNI